MSSKQDDKNEPCSGRQDIYSERSATNRKRQYSTQSHDTEVSCMSQETVTTGLSFETDCNTSVSKRSYGRSVSFCLANENEDIADDPCNDSEIRDSSIDNAFKNNTSLRPHSNDSANHVYNSIFNEEIGQENMPRHVFSLPVNSSRGCSQNSFSEENCRQPLLRRQSTFSRGTINEHPNDSEIEAWYAGLQGNFKDSVHPFACNFDHSQCQKLYSSVRVLKRVVFVLCVFNIILLIALIIVPTFAVLYIQAGKESNPGTQQLPSSSEQHRPEPSCVKCEYLMKMFPNFIKTQNVIESIGDDGKCCFSDPGKLMTILNQISEEAFERAKGSISSSGPWISNGSEPTPAVHLKSRGNGLINVSIDLVKKGIESTHFVGWQRASQREVQGLWGEVNADGASIKVKSSGMYFVYTMIQHKSSLKSYISENMTTPSFSMPPIPQKVTLYICQHGEEGVKDISRISQMYYSTDNRVQQNTYFGRIIHLKENDSLYLGISGYGFIHQESESHYIGFYKI